MRRISLFLTLLVLMGCASRQVIQHEQRDSVRVEVVLREVVHYDTIQLEIAPCYQENFVEQRDSSILENLYSRSTAMVLGSGELHHTLEQLPQLIAKPIAPVIEVRDTLIYRERTIQKVLYKERELTPWQRFQMRGFYFLLALFISLLLFRWSV